MPRPREMDVAGPAIEDEQIAVAEDLVKALSIPVSVKLSMFYTNPLHVISRFDQVGVKGFVLFNRMFQPDIDIDQEKHITPLNLSNTIDSRLPLRFAGLLAGKLQGDICSSTGIFFRERCGQNAARRKRLRAGRQRVVYEQNHLYSKHASGH